MEAPLSIIIPSINEEDNLPLLLADLKYWHIQPEIIIVDGGSSDNTILISKLYGAKVIKANEPNRGKQLLTGSKYAKGEWLLFLHADSRLPKEWAVKVKGILRESFSKETAWFFDFSIDSKHLSLLFMKICVSIRSSILKKPYGDQGLLIHKEVYNKIGGHKEMYLMEDVDIIRRLTQYYKLKSLKIPIITSKRKWERNSVLKQAIRNARLRYKFSKGESTYSLYKEYYRK